MIYSETAVLFPHLCFICERTDGPFIDLQRDDDEGPAAGAGQVAFGTVKHYYVCGSCAYSMTQITGPVTNRTVIATDQLTELRSRLALAEGDIDGLLANNADLRAAFDLVRNQPSPEPAVDEEPVKARATTRKATAKR